MAIHHASYNATFQIGIDRHHDRVLLRTTWGDVGSETTARLTAAAAREIGQAMLDAANALDSAGAAKLEPPP